MSVLSQFKQHLKSNPEIAKMIMPSTKSEVFLDLDGDNKVDFAYIDSTGDGRPDTFAVDLTGDGSLDVYFFDSDGNGIADNIQYYPDGSDTPAYTYVGKEIEDALGGYTKQLHDSIVNLELDSFVATLNGIKAKLLEAGKTFETNGTLGAFRRMMKADPEIAKLICPSAQNEIFLDLDGDGKADFAFIDSNRTNNLDTFAIDITADGEFDLYLIDTDNNGLADSVKYYADGADEPTEGGQSTRLEEALRPATEKFTAALRSQFDSTTLKEALIAYKEDLISILKSLR